MKHIYLIIMLTTILGCSSKSDYKTKVKYVDLDRFMGQWYVIAGRLTSFEDGAHNALETYTWNKEEERIDVDFTMRVDSFKGKLKSIPQKAWVHNKKTNAHWKISPFWPLKLNYLIVEVAEDYSWTVVGVPGQEWVWIMAKEWNISDEKLEMILNRTKTLGYSVRDVRRVPHLW